MRTITSLGSFAVKNDGSEDFKTYVLEPLNKIQVANGHRPMSGSWPDLFYGLQKGTLFPAACHYKSFYDRILTVSQVKEFLSGTGEEKIEASKMMEDSRKTMDLFFRDKFHAVEYAGYWHLQTTPDYGGKDILNAEDVGVQTAENNAKLIAKLINEYYAA